MPIARNVEDSILECQECLVGAINSLENVVEENEVLKDIRDRISYLEHLLGKYRREAS